MSANVVPEVRKLRKQTRVIPNVQLKDGMEKKVEGLFKGNDGAFEIEGDFTPGSDKIGIDIYNDKGELSQIYLNLECSSIVAD